jgi:ribosomal protein S18 acetylase RimI-like enzyme
MTTTIRTRIAESADAAGLAQLVRLNALFNGASDSAEQIAARLADPRRVETIILAEIDGRIVGFAALRLVPCIFFTEPYAELTELYVDEGYRRRGIGKALIAHVERLAREAGARQMLILTDFYNNAAQSLYRSMGYAHYDIALTKDFIKK